MFYGCFTATDCVTQSLLFMYFHFAIEGPLSLFYSAIIYTLCPLLLFSSLSEDYCFLFSVFKPHCYMDHAKIRRREIPLNWRRTGLPMMLKSKKIKTGFMKRQSSAPPSLFITGRWLMEEARGRVVPRPVAFFIKGIAERRQRTVGSMLRIRTTPEASKAVVEDLAHFNAGGASALRGIDIEKVASRRSTTATSREYFTIGEHLMHERDGNRPFTHS